MTTDFSDTVLTVALSAPGSSASARISTQPASAQDEFAALEHCTVLVAYGDEIVREILGFFLQSVCAQVFTACSAQEALALLAQHPTIDIAVMEIEDQEIDGIATIEKIRSQNWLHMKLPIIAHSACAQRELIQAAFHAGLNQFVPITCERRQLYREMVKALAYAKRLPV